MTGGPARRRRQIERSLGELDAWYAAGETGPQPTARGRPSRGSGRRRRAGLWSLGGVLQGGVVTVTLVGLLLWLLPGSRAWHDLVARVRPTGGTAASGPGASAGGGGYTFLQDQPSDPGRPVTYDPCVVIHVAVNHRGAPPEADRMVRETVASVARATALPLVVDPADSTRSLTATLGEGAVLLGEPRRQPVLVGWATPDELPGLAGDVAGLGGSVAVLPGATGVDATYVTGQVALDGPAFAEIAREPRGYEESRAIVMHELGHVVGLGHVDDVNQLMAPRASEVADWGPGDLRGLALLGRGRCQSGSRTDPWDPGSAG